ncbi:MAG: NUDIX hydrolase [Magnetococcales bacterium]|nr:NUDIX hydrolase [Magnetococcales bacterium]
MRVKATVSAHVLLVECVAGGAERVLMVRLAYKDHRWRKWSFPGGFVDEGEGLEAALLREVAEEIGVGLQTWEQVAVIPSLGQEQPHVSFVFLCREWLGEVECRSHELLEAAWVDRSMFARFVQEGALAYPVMCQQMRCLGWGVGESEEGLPA